MLEHLDFGVLCVTVNKLLSMWKGDSDEISQCGCHTIWSDASDNEHLLEWFLVKRSPLKREWLVLWSQLIVPLLETSGGLLGKMVGELLKSLNLNQLLNGVPLLVLEPLVDWGWVWHEGSGWAVNQEVHLLWSVFHLQDSLLHESECDLSEENKLMALEQTS